MAEFLVGAMVGAIIGIGAMCFAAITGDGK